MSNERYEDTPELFGGGCGGSTDGEITCGFCGQIYNKGCNDDDGYENCVSVLNTTFAGLDVCDCCFHLIEAEVLARMSDIIPWYIRRIKTRKARLDRDTVQLLALLQAGQK